MIDLLGFLAKVRNQVWDSQEMMRRNGFVIDNLDDRWQKLAFTLYTDIAQLSTGAEQIITELLESSEEVLSQKHKEGTE